MIYMDRLIYWIFIDCPLGILAVLKVVMKNVMEVLLNECNF